MGPFVETKEKIVRNQISRVFLSPSHRWFYSDGKTILKENQRCSKIIEKMTCRRKEGKESLHPIYMSFMVFFTKFGSKIMGTPLTDRIERAFFFFFFLRHE